MDRRFLKEVTKGYITNHDVYSEYTPKEVDLIEKTIYEDLCELATEIRVVDEDMYNRVYFSNRLEQYSILENYLNIRYQKEDESQIIQEDYILDESLSLGGVVGWVIDMFIKVVAGLIGNIYLLACLSAIIIIIYRLNGNAINRGFFGFFSGVGKRLESFGKSIKTQGKYFQFRYAIAEKNFDKCYQKCGLESLKTLGLKHFLTKYIGDSQSSNADKQQAQCLAECYVETTIERINIALSMYLNCLKSTKEFDKVSNFKGSEFFQFIKSKSFTKYGFNTNSICNEYLDTASDLLNDFDDLLDYIYKNPSSKRQVINRLMIDMNKTVTEESKDRNVIQKQVYPQKFKKRR